MIKSIGTAVFSLGLLMMTFGQTAAAQEGPVQGMLEACQTEIETSCAKVNPGQGRLFACMYAYEDQVSDRCSKAIIDFADAMDYLFASANETMTVCAPDIEEKCSDVAFGGGRILSCLAEKKSDVTPQCQAAAAGFAERFGLN
ncbi:cysteine rich repeat-containing protein [Pseudovibrio sp. Tun.PSC04-5.I4]|uniref:cysteine rich repeat-containing protein n=1 Tax=Pseudovibrio sp. Tun.PSC04-5.I4 TaxID=1798213 RepID=UPI000891B2BE|nr:cysteine rich repeat-containing protein [Pseudovibrio sp. Tun.PSC04-5.I4]SDR21218.1 Cysteine rich repeat-containing protein [Pseudovibrio sp. Tun.PSC04-5.I4]